MNTRHLRLDFGGKMAEDTVARVRVRQIESARILLQRRVVKVLELFLKAALHFHEVLYMGQHKEPESSFTLPVIFRQCLSLVYEDEELHGRVREISTQKDINSLADGFMIGVIGLAWSASTAEVVTNLHIHDIDDS